MERNGLCCLLPHPLRLSTKLLATSSVAFVADRMAMARRDSRDLQNVGVTVLHVGVLT